MLEHITAASAGLYPGLTTLAAEDCIGQEDISAAAPLLYLAVPMIKIEFSYMERPGCLMLSQALHPSAKYFVRPGPPLRRENDDE